MEDGPVAPAARSPRHVWLALALWLLLADAWFQGPLLGAWGGRWAAPLIATVLLLIIAWRLRSRYFYREPPDRRFRHIFAGVLLLATIVRLPALLAPGSLISSDSAVAGIIAQELRAGELPAPVYAPGFPYEGTLKPHLTALLGRLFVSSAGTPFLYTLSSHLLYLLWVGAVMALARRVAGNVAAAGAGLFMAVSPRFLTAFSLNNVGQYPEVNALGALGLALLARGGGLLLPAFATGMAVWQQLVGVYFLFTLAVAALLTPHLRRWRALAEGLFGFAAGSYPVWIWNAAHGWATFDFFRRGGKRPLERLAGFPEQLERTLSLSFPKMFGLTDSGLPEPLAAALGLALPLLVLAMAWSKRREMRERRAESAGLLLTLLFAVTIGVFALSKFSHRGAPRPRYLIPLYTPVAVATGWGLFALAKRSRAAAAVAGAAVLGLNTVGLVPWLRARAHAQARDEAFVEGLVRLGVRTGYAGFWVAPKYTFLADGRFVLSGELGPDVSWVHAGHAALVRSTGPDAYVVSGGELAGALSTRLESLGVAYERAEIVSHTVFHHLSRPVTLEEIAGYDTGARPSAPAGEIGESIDFNIVKPHSPAL